MPPPPQRDGDELASSPQWIPQSTQDPAQIPPNTAMDDMDTETIGFVSPFDDLGSFPWLPPESPPFDLSEIINFAAPSDAPEDRRPWSTDADMPGVNDAAAPQAAPPVPVGGGGHAAPCCATCLSTTEIQHLEEEENAQRRFDSWKSDVEQRLFGEVDPLTAPDEKLTEDGRPSGRDADMPEVNDAATQPGPLPVAVGRGDAVPFACATSEHVEDEAQRRFGSFNSAIEQDLLAQGHTPTWTKEFVRNTVLFIFAIMAASLAPSTRGLILEESCDISMGRRWSIVRFTGPDSKGRKPHQGGWKEKSMTGMRAVADPSSPQPPAPGQQQRYVGLKKTLELDDDGNGNKWRAHEYTPLVPSDDGSDKLVPADISLRVEFKEDEKPSSSWSSSSSSSSSLKRSRTGAQKDGPKTAPRKSHVWDEMTQVHVKVTTNKDGSQRKKPCYKVMYAICHHCDQVFNADSDHGTHNLSNHLKSSCKCNCTCTHSHS